MMQRCRRAIVRGERSPDQIAAHGRRDVGGYPDAARFRDRFDSEPWLAAERDLWLVIELFSMSGRELHAGEEEWALHMSD